MSIRPDALYMDYDMDRMTLATRVREKDLSHVILPPGEVGLTYHLR